MPTKFKRDLKTLIGFEGFRPTIYPDSNGYSIGHGHYLTEQDYASGKYKNGVSKQQAMEDLVRDTQLHDAEADKIMEGYGIDKSKLTHEQLNGVYNAVYQNGITIGKKFPAMFKAIKAGTETGDFSKAAFEAEHFNASTKSKWFTQTPKRVKAFQKAIQDTQGVSASIATNRAISDSQEPLNAPQEPSATLGTQSQSEGVPRAPTGSQGSLLGSTGFTPTLPIEDITPPAIVRDTKIEAGEVSEFEPLQVLKDTWSTQTSVGMLASYSDIIPNPDQRVFDPNFNPTSYPEFKQVLEHMEPELAAKYTRMALNKEHFSQLMSYHNGQEAKNARLAASYQDHFWKTMGVGMGAQLAEPMNYMVPYGAAAQGLSKATKGIVNLHNVLGVSTMASRIGSKLIMRGLDNLVEEATIQTTLSALTPEPLENQGIQVAQAVALGSLFDLGGGFIGKSLADRKVAKLLSKDLEHLGTLTKHEHMINQLNEIISHEKSKIDGGQLSAKYHDGLVDIKEGLELEYKVQQDAYLMIKHEREVTQVRKKKAQRHITDNAVETAKSLEVVEATIKKLRAKKTRLLSNTSIAKIAGEKNITSAKGLKALKKKLSNKINKEIKAEMNKAYDVHEANIKELTKTLNKNLIDANNYLPDNTKFSKEEFMAINELQGSGFTPKQAQDVLSGKSIGAQVMGAVRNDSAEFAQITNFMPKDAQLTKLVADHALGKNASQQVSNSLIESLGLGAMKDSWYSRMLLNKTALAKGNNPFAGALYDLIAASYGRSEGKMGVSERAVQLNNITVGALHKVHDTLMADINTIDKSITGIRSLSWIEDVMTKNLRDYLIDPEVFMARTDITEELKGAYAKAGKGFDAATKRQFDAMKEAGVKGTENMEYEPNFFHRNWNNESWRELENRIGSKNTRTLIEDSMRSQARKNALEAAEKAEGKVDAEGNTKEPKEPTVLQRIREEFITDIDERIEYSEKEINAIIKNKLKVEKLRFGMTHIDLEDRLSTTQYAKVVKSLVTKGVDDPVLNKIFRTIKERESKTQVGLSGARAKVDLNTKITVGDNTYTMSDMLHSNIFETQGNYFRSHNGRTAFAEAGIKDVEVLDELVKSAAAFERSKGNVAQAEYIKKHVQADLDAVRYNRGMNSGNDLDSAKIIRLVKKYQFNRLLQYTGFSSIAEMGAVAAEAGSGVVVREIGRRVNDKLAKHLSFVKPHAYRADMQDGLQLLTGIGLEDFQMGNFTGTSTRALKSATGAGVERVAFDELARATRALAGVERANREIALNSMAIGLFNNIKNGKKASYLFGGISDTNLTEMGLGKFESNKITGKMEFNSNENFKTLQGAFKKATEKNGSVTNFNTSKWTPKEKQQFAYSLGKIMNHLLVDPDSMTAKGWHSSLFGNIIMQFKSFEVNAASKVTGRAVAVLGDAYKNGDYRELSKGAQKLILSTAFGKIALVATAAVSNMGAEDWEDKVTAAIWDDDAGIQNILTSTMRSSVASGVKDIFETAGMSASTSTYKNSSSLNPIRRISQSPTGQATSAAFGVGNSLMEGKYLQASQNALKLTPFYRTLGINVFANMYLDL